MGPSMKIKFFINILIGSFFLIVTFKSYGLSITSDEGISFITSKIADIYCKKAVEYKTEKQYLNPILFPIIDATYENSEQFEQWAVKYDDMIFENIRNCLVSILGIPKPTHKDPLQSRTFHIAMVANIISSLRDQPYDPIDMYKNPELARKAMFSIYGGFGGNGKGPNGLSCARILIISKLHKPSAELFQENNRIFSIEYQMIDFQNQFSDTIEISLP